MKNTYLKVFLILCVLIFGTIATARSQETLSTAKRILITSPTYSQLRAIQESGIDLHCGAKFEGDDLRLDLQFSEVQKINELGLTYQVIQNDLSRFYEERAAATREQAEKELAQMQERTLALRAESQNSRSSSFSTGEATIESFIQREECDEVDWVSTNFRLGGFEDPNVSFGGCLTVDEVRIELERMKTLFPGLISTRMDASPSGQKTHGNTTDTSFDPQTIWYVRISNDPQNDHPTKPEVLYTGMTHAREVNSMMNIIYYMWWVLENYDLDPAIKNLVDNQELYFVPIVNPDGVKWNEIIRPNGGGLQRKNLRPNVNDCGDTSCTFGGSQQQMNALRGVDLNRNASYYWGFDNVGSSPTQSSDTYRGPFPASEPETQIMADFVQSRDFKYAINHHSGINSIVTSSYNGNPNAAPSNREDEYQKLLHDITRYNRYIHGSAPNTLTSANGDTNDYMLGGPDITYNAFIDSDGDNFGNPGFTQSYTAMGSGENIITFSPENGDDFWPPTNDIVPIAQRALRMNLLTAFYAGKYARLHDFTKTSVNSLTPQIDFEIEYLGQTASDLTLTITPISANITSVTQPTVGALNGMDILEQRSTSATLTLDPSINANDEIEYQVTLSNDTNVIYEVNYKKFYNSIDFVNVDGGDNWFFSGDWSETTDGYNGSTNAITSTPSPPYNNNELSFATLDYSFDLSSTSQVILNFHAKWDIERNFDLAQLEVSIDGGSTYNAICGKYTKVASGQQGNFHLNKSASDQVHQANNGSILYDGDLILDPEVVNTASPANDVDKWVLEEFLIDATNNPGIVGNSDVRFRFRFDTDSSNRKDGYDTNFEGMTFDNFKIVGSNIIANRLCAGNMAVTNFPYTESFETNFGLWAQDTSDDINWTRIQGPTPSGANNPDAIDKTGPSGASEGDDYIYTESSGGGSPTRTARLTSPCFDLTDAVDATLTFDYHMFGLNMGSLSLEISIDNGQNWTSLFSRSGQQPEHTSQASPFTTATLDLNALGYTGETIRLRLVGVTGSDFTSDMAVDNLTLSKVISTDYVYDAGSWTPSDPSGIATSFDNITVISGTGPLTADTDANNVTVETGAVLDLGTTTLSLSQNIINNGTIDGDEASLLLIGDTAQIISGNSFEIGILTVDNLQGTTIQGAVDIQTLLTLTNGVLNTNGNLILSSDIDGSAMVAPITGGSITGNVITEQYIPAKRAFRLIGSTVTTTSTIQSNWQESLSSTPSFGTHITGSTDGSNGFDATGSGNYSLFTLNNAAQAWEAVTNTDVNTLTAGQPLRLMVRGDRTIDLTSNLSPATITTLRATGQLATGTVTTTGASLNHTANAFNFIGNPYHASVNVNDVLGASNNINSNQMFVWDATLGERGQYVTVTLDGMGSSNGANTKNYHFLQPGQAVFTRTLSTVTDNSTSVIFAENHKAVGQDIPIYANETNDLFTSAHIIGRLYRTEKYGLDEGLQDNFVVLFNSQYDNEITPSDASKFYNIDENMAISKGETLLSIEQRAMPEEGDELQFFNALYRTSEYTLDIDIEGLDGVTPYFIDTFTQASTMLSEGWNTLNLTVDQDNEESMASDRFKITYAIDELSIDNVQSTQIALYPNPITQGAITITASTLTGQDAQIVLHNILGQQVYSSQVTFTNGTTTIYNLNNLQSGVYFMTVQNDTLKSTQRIIVK